MLRDRQTLTSDQFKPVLILGQLELIDPNYCRMKWQTRLDLLVLNLGNALNEDLQKVHPRAKQFLFYTYF